MRLAWWRICAPALAAVVMLPLPAAGRQHKCFGKQATIVGTRAADRIEGTPHDDVIVALADTDFVAAGGGNDLICLGAGGRPYRSDQALGQAGRDRISGGSGWNVLYGNEGADFLIGGDDGDVLHGSEGNDVVRGGRQRDYIDGDAGDDVLRGQRGSDEIGGGPGDDVVDGGAGARAGDMVSFFSSKSGVVVDLSAGMSRGPGSDRLVSIENVSGSDEADRIVGDDNDNVLQGWLGNDVLKGKGGDDCLNPGVGSNRAFGNAGFDNWSPHAGFHGHLFDCFPDFGSGFIDPLEGVTVDLEQGTAIRRQEHSLLYGIEGAFGTEFHDELIGDAGPNYFFAGPSNDEVNGRAGDDLLDGGGGWDQIDGGDDNDECLNGEVLVECE